MQQGTLVHPQWLSRLTPTFFVASCTIQQAVETQSATGSIVHTWTDVAGLVGLGCRIAPQQADERRSPVQKYADTTHVCVINAFYAEITEQMQAIIDSATYEIVGVETDGNQTMTRMYLRVVR